MEVTASSGDRVELALAGRRIESQRNTRIILLAARHTCSLSQVCKGPMVVRISAMRILELACAYCA